MWWAVVMAWAGEPVVTVTGENSVMGTVSVTTAPAEVLRRLADPVWVTGIDGGTTRVTVTGREGACLLADYVSPSFVMDVTYSVRQCPTAAGVVSTMVTSNAFHSYRTEWRVEGEGTGSRLTYRLDMDSKLFVPESVVQSTARKAVLRMMERLAAHFGPV